MSLPNAMDRPLSVALRCALLLGQGCIAEAALAAAGGLPPAPRAIPQMDRIDYYLTLSVNGHSDGQLVPVSWRDGGYRVDADALRQRRVRVPDGVQGEVALDSLPDVASEYDGPSQQLRLTVPSSWLPQQNVSGQPLVPRVQARSSLGMLFNYDIYQADSDAAGNHTSAWLEQRLFGRLGMVSNNGVYRSSSGRGSAAFGGGYVRYDTTWRYNDEERMIAYQAGDVISNSLTWSSSVRIGGVRIGRDFSVRPDVITYPTLAIAGENGLPSTVDLFVNGYRASSSDLDAGPFVLSNVPYVSGAGEATVVTTDALGRQVATSVPFYVANTLLREGLSDFDATFGGLRTHYGVRDFGYGRAAFSGLYRYGASDRLTWSVHGEASAGFVLAGAGADVGLGRYGILSLAASRGDDETGAGNQYVAGYSYRSRAFSINLQHRYRQSGFADIATIANGRGFGTSRRASQATFGFSPFGMGRGSASLGYYDIVAGDMTRTRLLNISYGRSLIGASSVHLSLNRDLATDTDTAYVQVVVPLQRGLGNASLAHRRPSTGGGRQQLNWNRAAPLHGGWGWNLGYELGGGDDYHQASVAWRGRYVQAQAGVYGDGDDTRWADVSGALVWMNGGLFASNRINDAFALVSTGGYADVPVRYENRLMGYTDRNGHLLVPSVSSYYPTRFGIDALELDADVKAGQVEQRIAVRQGSGALVSFDMAPLRAASVVLHDGAGRPLPPGQLVTLQPGGLQTYTGHDGLVYLEDLQTRDNRVLVQMRDGSRCRAAFDLPAGATSGTHRIGPLTCAADTPAASQPGQDDRR